MTERTPVTLATGEVVETWHPDWRAECLTCSHSALRRSEDDKVDKAVRAMARAGFANCLQSEFKASFFPFGHRCERWAAAPADVVAARHGWLERKEVAA